MVSPLRCAAFQDGRAAGGTLADRRPHDLKTAAQAGERGHMLAIDTGATMGLLFGGALCQIIHKCSWQEKICGGASGWLTPGFLAALPIAFHCFSLGILAAYCPLSSLIFMRFCPAPGLLQVSHSGFPTSFSTASLHGSCVRPSLCERISNGSDFRLLPFV